MLTNFNPSVRVCERAICNLHFADYIDLIAANEKELQEVAGRLDDATLRYTIEIKER